MNIHRPSHTPLSRRSKTTFIPKTNTTSTSLVVSHPRLWHGGVSVDVRKVRKKVRLWLSQVTNALYRSRTRSTSDTLHSKASVFEVNCTYQILSVVEHKAYLVYGNNITFPDRFTMNFQKAGSSVSKIRFLEPP